MRWNRSTGLALLLIGFGAVILLERLGLGIGHVFHILFPLILIALGYIGVQNNRKWIGWSFMIVGAVVLFGKLSGILTIVAAVALIFFGVKLLKRNNTNMKDLQWTEEGMR